MTLHFETVSPQLRMCLVKMMNHKAFDGFYLVGGTALALQLGHRVSIDIDLFCNVPYGEMNVRAVKAALEELFPYTDCLDCLDERQMIYTVFVGNSREDEIKVDICYDDAPIFDIMECHGIRMLSDKDIAAMKILAITTGERRKDYWDIHELLGRYTLEQMIAWGEARYPYSLDREEVLSALRNVWSLRDMTDVMSLKDGYWELVADDLCYEAGRVEDDGGGNGF